MNGRTTFQRTLSPVVILGILMVLTVPGFAQKKKTPPAKPQKNETKGQNQLTGGLVKFGEIYTMNPGYNLQILKAKYTVEPFTSYGGKLNGRDTKLVVLDVAFKNARPEANDRMNIDLFSIIDSTGKVYNGEIQLKSYKCRELYINLKPGQGLGQVGLNDPLQVAFEVPLDAVITKIMVNQPRLGKKEEVLRYLIAGTDKEADPTNVITPLPSDVADPANGAIATKYGKVTVGKPFYSGYYTYIVEKVETVGKLSDQLDPGEGKKFLVVTLTTKNGYGKQVNYYDSILGESVAIDADGDSVALTSIVKKSSTTEVTTSTIEDGESITTRLVFTIGADQKLKSLKLVGPRYPWILALDK